MPTLETSTRNSILEKVRDLIDAGSSAGTLVFEASDDSEVATCTFSDPCAGSASSGTLTFSSITSDTNATGGTIDHVSVYDSDSNKILEFSIATDSSEDIQISTLSITAGDTVGVSSLSLTMPAS